MATVHYMYPDKLKLFENLKKIYDTAKESQHLKHLAVILLQRMARGYLVRKYLIKLNENAITIQCAFRMHMAKKVLRMALRDRVLQIPKAYYDKNATLIQATWRGYLSRKRNFCYYRYKRWLKTVKEIGERKAAEAFEYRIRSRADDLRILENDARQWLAFVVFKLHHLLRTFVIAGVYSDPATTELTEFEKLLKMIRYTEYMKKLRRKYDEFVRKHRPMYNNKQLFPVIGYGADYWYLSMLELYNLTSDVPSFQTHKDPIHAKPFVWRKVSRCMKSDIKGPFNLPLQTKAPPATANMQSSMGPSGDHHQEDPRFNLYVKHYTPKPDIFKYVNYHINVIVNRKNEIMQYEF